MTKKELVLIASHVMALYFIFWAFDNLSFARRCVFTFSLPPPSGLGNGQDYLFKYHLLLVLEDEPGQLLR